MAKVAKEVPTDEKGASEKVRPSGAEKAAKFREAFGKKQASVGAGQAVAVQVPGTQRSVVFNKVEVVDNRICIWTGNDHTISPDFVVVNPPTDIIGEMKAPVEDPLTAIAIIIDGATQ